MGTRHLIAVVLDGTHRIAQYGQWDGYPDGQGVDVMKFAKSLSDDSALEKFKEKVRLCRFGTKEEIDSIYDSYSRDFENSPFGHLSRDTGSDILDFVSSWQDSNTPILLKDSWEFAADGLFCEWAYVIDLDKKRFEVYDGFHKGLSPNGGRFDYLNKSDSDYAPVWEIASFTFEQLEDMTDDGFVAICHWEESKRVNSEATND